MKKDQEGFGLLYSIVAAIVVVAIVVAGILVYNHDHKKTNNSTSSNSSDKSRQASNSASNRLNTQTTSPYSGWKTASLQYEKASFKYPTAWQISNTSKANGLTGNVSPGSDTATLTSPTGLEVSIKTGVTGIGGGYSTVLASQTINTLGASYYLDFYTVPGESNAYTACVETASTNKANYPYSKNVTVTNSNSKPYDVICMQYPDGRGNVVSKPVSSFKADSSYHDAILVIESLAY